MLLYIHWLCSLTRKLYFMRFSLFHLALMMMWCMYVTYFLMFWGKPLSQSHVETWLSVLLSGDVNTESLVLSLLSKGLTWRWKVTSVACRWVRVKTQQSLSQDDHSQAAGVTLWDNSFKFRLRKHYLHPSSSPFVPYGSQGELEPIPAFTERDTLCMSRACGRAEQFFFFPYFCLKKH